MKLKGHNLYAEHWQNNEWKIYQNSKTGRNYIGTIIKGKCCSWIDKYGKVSKADLPNIKTTLFDFAQHLRSNGPIQLFLCESERLYLKPGVLYLFSVDPECAKCKKLEEKSR